MIEFQSVEIENFMSIEKASMTFNEGKHLIIGKNMCSDDATSNGSGKSSLIEAIIWCLYKKTTRDPPLSRENKGDTKVSVKYIIDSKIYQVDRYLDHSTFGSSVKLTCDNDDISSRNDTQTDKEIINTLNINFDLFTSTIIIQQGIPVNFCNLGSTIRKSIIEEMFGFTMWEATRSKFAAEKTAKTTEKNLVELDYTKKKNEMIELNTKVELLTTLKNKGNSEYIDRIVAVKSQIVASQAQMKALEDNKISVLSNCSELDVRSMQSTTTSSLWSIERRLSDLESILATGVCGSCSQPFPVSQVKAATDEQTMLLENKKGLSDKLSNIKTMISSVDLLNAQIQTERSSIENNSKVLVSLANEANSTIIDDSELAALQGNLNSIVETVNSIWSQVAEANKYLEHCQYFDTLLLPSSKFRSNILKKYLSYINTTLEEVTPLIYGNLKIELDLDKQEKGVELYIHEDGKPKRYKSFSGGERRRIDIIIILSFQRFLVESSGISTNLLIFDEIFDGLDSKGMEKVLNCIDSLFPESSSIYVISHNDSIKSMFDNIITVTKKDKISTVEGVTI